MFTALLTPLVQTFAATCNAKDPANFFFGLKPWYYYLQITADQTTGRCELTNFKLFGADSSFLLIALVIIDDLLRIAALVAVGFIIWGGITYATSQGSPDQTGKAQNTIVNALIGLVVAILSASLVAFIGGRLGA